MRPSWSCVLLFALLAVPSVLVAQYRLSPTDTLHYGERTEGVVTMRTPSGSVVVRSMHDAVLGVCLEQAGTASAWYERLSLLQEGPGARLQNPSTDAVLRQPFVLSFSPRGRVSTQSVPAFPKELAGITDLSHQFEDFFISLPAAALQAGTAWADTMVHERTGQPDEMYRTRRVRSYRVERDTVVAGMSALVISVRQLVELEASSPMEGQPLLARTQMKGSEEGIALFSVAQGRLLSRERTGTLSGTFSMEGGPTPISFPQTYEYTSRLSLLP